MDAEIKKRWIEALRSGDYIQCQEALRIDRNLFCCLGVLCDIYNNKLWVIQKDHKAIWYKDKDDEFANASTIQVPPIIADKIGITDKQQAILVTKNDGGDSFQEIADYIEKNL